LWLNTYMIASAKEIDALNITLFNSCINFTNVHLCNYCTKIFVIVLNTCVCRRSVDNKALILSYPIHTSSSNSMTFSMTFGFAVAFKNFQNLPCFKVNFYLRQFNRHQLWCPQNSVLFALFNCFPLLYIVVAFSSAVTN